LCYQVQVGLGISQRVPGTVDVLVKSYIQVTEATQVTDFSIVHVSTHSLLIYPFFSTFAFNKPPMEDSKVGCRTTERREAEIPSAKENVIKTTKEGFSITLSSNPLVVSSTSLADKGPQCRELMRECDWVHSVA
jgi:hypothetical protein